jgi:mannitol-1-phosphate/altronate dehydrogenase
MQEPESRVVVPSYDRSRLGSSVVHFGVGGFHRAHQAVFFDDLAERGVSQDWGVTGVSLRSESVKSALAPQNFSYTALLRGPASDEARVIGAIKRCLHAPRERNRVLQALADPATQLVTITVTGDGYLVDPKTMELDESDPALRADLENPAEPETLPGFIVEALRIRRARGLGSFTVLSCDNLPDNGRVARQAVLEVARMRDEALADWIERNTAFPCSVVDRITPQTTDRERRLLARRFGVRDRWPVVGEDFAQWVIEDTWSGDRPPLDEVGASFVADVEDHATAKRRMLNGAHCAIGYMGYIEGHREIARAMDDARLRRKIGEMLEDEVIPQLASPDGVDLREYKETLLARFANRRVGDRLSRLCARGSTKMPAYLLPTLERAVRDGLPRRRLMQATAAWVHFLGGRDRAGQPIEVEDALAGELRPLARAAVRDPMPLLRRTDIFGELGRSTRFARELRGELMRLRFGVRAGDFLAEPEAVLTA